MKYPDLFSPICPGRFELRNRIVMPPVTTGFAGEGYLTDTMIACRAARAERGVDPDYKLAEEMKMTGNKVYTASD
jgi:2,4-dienoyl-CoA reductase-like NADH-dependent reductase (Old Yellow Enzyme family)